MSPMRNDFSRRGRRAAWRCAALAFLVSVRSCNGARNTFSTVGSDCQAAYRSAWGHPAARKHALNTLKKSSACPSARRVSVRAQAALIAANTDFGDSSSECYDGELDKALTEKCASKESWTTLFKSLRWHAHADGRRIFGDFANVELALLVAIFVTHTVLNLEELKRFLSKVVKRRHVAGAGSVEP